MESQAEAIRSIKSGSLYNTIAIIIAIAMEIAYMLNPKFILSFQFVAISLVDYFILLYGFTRMRYGFLGLSRLTDVRTDLGGLGISIFIFGVIALIFSDLFFPLFYVGAALVAIGNALIGVTLYRVGTYYKAKLISVGGILIALSVGSLIGYVLVYTTSDKVIEEISKIPPKPPFEIKTSDKSIGYGILKSSGIAEFKVNYDKEAEIVAVKFQGYEFPVLEISPKNVKMGENLIKIKFNLTAPLVPGNIYNVELMLSNNEKLLASLVYEM